MSRKTINLNAEDEILWSKIKTVMFAHEKGQKFSKLHQDLPLSCIQSICAKVWHVSEGEVLGKVNHNNPFEKECKVSFLWACYWFSNKNQYEVAEYLGCTFTLARNSKFAIYHQVEHRLKFHFQYLKLLNALSQQCKGRLDKILLEVEAMDAPNKNQPQRSNPVEAIDFSQLNNQIRENRIRAQENLIDTLRLKAERLEKEIQAIKRKQKPEKVNVLPSAAVCFDCPARRRCVIKEQGFALCPRLMQLNNQQTGKGSGYVYWWQPSIIKKETIKEN